MTPTGWEHFFDILRSTSNINATSSSNHTLSSLGGRYARRNDLPKDLEFCLQLNEEKDKKNVIREKIFHYHLNDTDLAPLFGTDQEILPDLLGWIGKAYNANENGIIGSSSGTVFYRIIRSFPDLCAFETYDRKIRYQLEEENAKIKVENATLKSEVVTLKTEKEELLRKIEQLTKEKAVS